jgi:hypothetical protein
MDLRRRLLKGTRDLQVPRVQRGQEQASGLTTCWGARVLVARALSLSLKPPTGRCALIPRPQNQSQQPPTQTPARPLTLPSQVQGVQGRGQGKAQQQPVRGQAALHRQAVVTRRPRPVQPPTACWAREAAGAASGVGAPQPNQPRMAAPGAARIPLECKTLSVPVLPPRGRAGP